MYLTRTAGIETPSRTWHTCCTRQMYLTRTAGIETRRKYHAGYQECFQCILPALRELKLTNPQKNTTNNRRMYLTRTAGIETSFGVFADNEQVCMYLTRTVGIETVKLFYHLTGFHECILPALRELKQRGVAKCIDNAVMYLTRTAGIETFQKLAFVQNFRNVSYPHCGN